MKIKKKEFILIVSLLLYLGVGFIGVYSNDFIANSNFISSPLKWFILPALIIAAYYAHRSSLRNYKKIALWRTVMNLTALTLIFSLLILMATEGYLRLYNCNIGEQTQIVVKGQVIKLKYPKRKKPLNTYGIEILLNKESRILKLDVPTNEYYVGQIFEKQMTKGSLGIIYSEK